MRPTTFPLLFPLLPSFVHEQLAMKAVPYRTNFYRVLGEPTDVVMAELDAWLSGLEKVVHQMDTVYKEGRYGSIDGKV